MRQLTWMLPSCTVESLHIAAGIAGCWRLGCRADRRTCLGLQHTKKPWLRSCELDFSTKWPLQKLSCIHSRQQGVSMTHLHHKRLVCSPAYKSAAGGHMKVQSLACKTGTFLCMHRQHLACNILDLVNCPHVSRHD